MGAYLKLGYDSHIRVSAGTAQSRSERYERAKRRQVEHEYHQDSEDTEEFIVDESHAEAVSKSVATQTDDNPTSSELEKVKEELQKVREENDKLKMLVEQLEPQIPLKKKGF